MFGTARPSAAAAQTPRWLSWKQSRVDGKLWTSEGLCGKLGWWIALVVLIKRLPAAAVFTENWQISSEFSGCAETSAADLWARQDCLQARFSQQLCKVITLVIRAERTETAVMTRDQSQVPDPKISQKHPQIYLTHFCFSIHMFICKTSTYEIVGENTLYK